MDLAVRDLLESGADPFALAHYFWVSQKHGVILVNTDRLSAWCVAWVRRVLIEGLIGRRADEEVAAAALVAASLTTSVQVADRREIAKRLTEKIGKTTQRSQIPFDSPTYAAALLIAAWSFDLDDPLVTTMTTRVVAAFQAAVPCGRLLGVAFAAELLNHTEPEACQGLRTHLLMALDDPALGYEGQVYAAQGICQLHRLAGGSDSIGDSDLLKVAQVIARAPVWPYLMSGVEEIEPSGDRKLPVIVSHHYRAALCDVVLTLQCETSRRHDAVVDRRLRGRKGTGGFAFVGIIASLSVPWLVIGWLMRPSIDDAGDYWLRMKYDKMDSSSALWFLSGASMVLFLAVWTPGVLIVLWRLLVRSAVESDRRTISVVWLRTKVSFMIWLAIWVPIISFFGERIIDTFGRL